jgi:hypothetical protein
MRRILALVFMFASMSFVLGGVATGQTNMTKKIETIRDNRGRINVGLPDDTQLKVEDLVQNRSLPIVKDLTYAPENPKPGEAVVVTAKIATYPRTLGDQTGEAYILYSTNKGMSWQQVSMEAGEEDSKSWKGEIPGQPKGTDVIFGIKAINYSGNMYIEAVCQVSDSPINDPAYVDNDCVHSGKENACDGKMPVGCMFPLAIKHENMDDDEQVIPSDLNFQDVRIGYNEENIYLDAAVQSRVTPGTISPMNVHLYVAAGLNPDRAAFGSGLESIMTQGAVMIYTPLNIANPCVIYYLKGEDIVEDYENGMCTSRDNHLVFSIKRMVTKPNPSNTMEFMLLDFVETGIMPLVIPLYDNTHFTRVRYENRGYQVK